MPRRPRTALIAAVACLLALLAVWAAAFLTPIGRWVDAATLLGFVDLHSASVDRLANRLGRLVDPGPFLLAGLVLIGVALARRRPRTAAVGPLVLLGPNPATQTLQPGLPRPRPASLLR